MMAARFRSVTWVAVAVVPALACYLVTQHVAAERAQLAKVERRIGQSRSAIRDLETELGTRGSMAQIERWNGETFALAAPAAEQFVTDGVRLASLTALPALPRPLAPAVPGAAAAQPAIATPAPTVPAAEATVRSVALPARPAPALPEVRQAAFRPVAPRAEAVAPVRQAAFKPSRRAAPEQPVDGPAPLLRQATYQAPPRARPAPTRVAMLDNGPLDAGTLADIGRIASAERGRHRR